MVSFLDGDWTVGPLAAALSTIEGLTSLGRHFTGVSITVLFCYSIAIVYA